MENVMTNAWGIAHEGVEKFGGKVSEYFAEALKIAWSLFKKGGNKMNEVKGTIKDFDLPELEGTEKQVEWAKKIRAASFATLQYEVTHEEYEKGRPKRPVKALVDALQSEEATQEYLNNLPEFLVKGTIESMNDLLDRYERMKEIATNLSAKFWIDNRDNQEKNFKFKLFSKYVQTGIKDF